MCNKVHNFSLWGGTHGTKKGIDSGVDNWGSEWQSTAFPSRSIHSLWSFTCNENKAMHSLSNASHVATRYKEIYRTKVERVPSLGWSLLWTERLQMHIYSSETQKYGCCVHQLEGNRLFAGYESWVLQQRICSWTRLAYMFLSKGVCDDILMLDWIANMRDWDTERVLSSNSMYSGSYMCMKKERDG